MFLPCPILQTPAPTCLPHYLSFELGSDTSTCKADWKCLRRKVPSCFLAAKTEDSCKTWMLCKADTAEVSRITCFTLGLTLPCVDKPHTDAYLVSEFAIIRIQCGRQNNSIRVIKAVCNLLCCRITSPCSYRLVQEQTCCSATHDCSVVLGTKQWDTCHTL